jgi:hypothetical protein
VKTTPSTSPCELAPRVAMVLRCFVRLPFQKRPKVILIHEAEASFEAFKAACAAKLGIAGEEPITVLLSSNLAADVKVDVDSLPEIEALDEITPEDNLIVFASSAGGHGAASSHLEGHGDVGAADSDDDEAQVQAEDDEDEEDEEEIELVSQHTRQSVMDGALDRAKRDGRYVECDDSDDDDDDDESDSDDGACDSPPSARAKQKQPGSSTSGKSASSGTKKRGRSPSAPTAPRAAPKPTIEAVLDDDTEPSAGATAASRGAGGSSDTSGGGEGASDLEKVKARIRKMLSRGLHAGTPEEEAASSMRLAEKLLAKHNLAQADVLQEDHVPEALRAGKAVVHLRSTKDLSPCQTKQWMHTLGHACTKNFACSYYFSSHLARGRHPAVCDFTFYGIATNASLAAFAFAASFNRIACLAARHSVPVDEYEAKRRRGEVYCSKAVYTTAARESYKDGLARGLLDGVVADKAKKELEVQRRLELAKEKASRGEAWQSSDDDDDDDDDNQGHVDDDGVGTKPQLRSDDDGAMMVGSASLQQGDGDAKPGLQSTKTAVEALAKYEREAKAAVALVAHTESVAKNFLKDMGVKLSQKKHSYTKSTWRRESYEKGKVDSKEIDINQRSIKGDGGGGAASGGQGQGKAKPKGKAKAEH